MPSIVVVPIACVISRLEDSDSVLLSSALSFSCELLEFDDFSPQPTSNNAKVNSSVKSTKKFFFCSDNFGIHFLLRNSRQR
ncbi:hypothetical protein D3C79_1045980 [compost metagenome]